MSLPNSQFSNLLTVSKQVIRDCALNNGAIVAANSFMPYYPKDAANYLYVWPRDAAFICMAAEALGINDIQQPFFTWLIERAEGWNTTGLFYEKYYLNGRKALSRFQPDQAGIVVFMVGNYIKKNLRLKAKYEHLITHTALGLTKIWNKNSFGVPTNDLWEGRIAYPDLEENFSYSTAACVAGLRVANQLFPTADFENTCNEMEYALLQSAKVNGYFCRSFGKLIDQGIDASLLGLIWPYEIISPTSDLTKNTIQRILQLENAYGLYRYEHDEYDGWMLNTGHRNKGAGYWPLLNFWLAIVLSKMGKKDDANKYFQKVLQDLQSYYIPEQIFSNNIQVSVTPLCWSHAMFVLASAELGLLGSGLDI